MCQSIFVSSAHFFFFGRGAYAQGSDGGPGGWSKGLYLWLPSCFQLAQAAGTAENTNLSRHSKSGVHVVCFCSVLGGSKSSRCDIMLQRCLILFPPWLFSLPLPLFFLDYLYLFHASAFSSSSSQEQPHPTSFLIPFFFLPSRVFLANLCPSWGHLHAMLSRLFSCTHRPPHPCS